jgi:tRNA threonylcarbamoyladenosine biosynthesis protein TsaB
LAAGVVSELVELLDPEPLYLRRPDAVAGAPRKPVS